MTLSRRAFLTAGAASALVLARARSARATVVVPVTAEALTRRSDDVVIATVRRSSSQWDGGHIVTDHEVDVLTALKGRLPPRSLVLVRTPGGVVGGIGQYIPGAPSLEQGRSYVLFLSGGVGSVRYLAHLTAAVMAIEGDPASGVVRVLPGEGLLSSGGAAGRVTGGAAFPLDALAAVVRSVGP